MIHQNIVAFLVGLAVILSSSASYCEITTDNNFAGGLRVEKSVTFVQTDPSKANQSKKSNEKLADGFIEEIPLTREEQEFVMKTCERKLGIDHNLVYAIVKAESNFDREAKSRTDSGLMQINRGNEDWVEDMLKRKVDLMDSMDNLEAGMTIYKQYEYLWESKYSGKRLIIMSLNTYNMGGRNYRKFMSNGYDYDDWYYGNKVYDIYTNYLKGNYSYEPKSNDSYGKN